MSFFKVEDMRTEAEMYGELAITAIKLGEVDRPIEWARASWRAALQVAKLEGWLDEPLCRFCKRPLSFETDNCFGSRMPHEVEIS